MNSVIEKETNNENNNILVAANKIMERDVLNVPFSRDFRRNANKYPKATIDAYEIPGQYTKFGSPVVFPKSVNPKEYDFVASLNPDWKILLDDATAILQHENGEISPSKIYNFYEHWLNYFIEKNRICLPFVVTNHNYEKNYIWEVINEFGFKLSLLIYDKDKIYKILNTLLDKDFSKEKFSELDVVKFHQCMIHAQKSFAKDVLEKLLTIFCSAKNISFDDKLEVYISLCIAIRYHFSDDFKKAKEMVIMATEVMDDDIICSLPTFVSERELYLMEVDLRKKQEDYYIEKFYNITKKNNDEIVKLEKEIERLNNKLNQLNVD